MIDVLLPWRLARRIHGPFAMFRFSATDAVGLGGFGGPPVAAALVEPAADPLIETGPAEAGGRTDGGTTAPPVTVRRSGTPRFHLPFRGNPGVAL
ncbi:hypothetical protein [Streptomyces sp. NPDC060002]|uniref:hypothetical protein n=1 Tax=Streptomyces sp. NPDC060002 TaxID=3347033 RepID=UPI0036CB41D8